MPQRVWHILKCADDFKVFLPPRPVDTSSISYTVLLKLTIAELEHAWSRAFARHACILQKCIDQSSAAATTYGELADRFLSLLQQPDSHFYFFAPTDVSDNGTEFILRSSIEGLSLQEILRYCPGRLADDKAVLFIIFQVVRALSLLHSLNIPHLGLSLQNIFVDSNHKCILGPANLFALQKQKECNRKKHPSSDFSARCFGGAQMLPAKISELSLMTTQWTMCTRATLLTAQSFLG
ncbi:unnamed protein product [Calicophoron daubneyi]|uniref:Protein kinase domain-containing protein n=1 Tax=Calicophoron daubneyi TaxID=300641 RepID=A0AAV2TU02_CALDB